MRDKIAKTITLFLILTMISSCSEETKEVINIEEPSTQEQTVEKTINTVESTEDPLIGKIESPLTGLMIDEKIAQRRPFAVTINNLPKALPQSGISQADIYYEVLAEGGITRIIAIFQDSDADKIGPVRSARHYFLDFVLDNDAIYIHHGGSPQAYSNINNLKVNDFDGMNIISFFFRDKERVNKKGMYEHSSYIDATKLFNVWNESSYRVNRKENKNPMFTFSEKEIELENGKLAEEIILPYANEQIATFEYDKGTKVYNRFQNSNVHLDELTGGQLSVVNIIIQYTSVYSIAGDDAGRREVKLVGSGDGMYITRGRAVPIKWSKSSHDSPTVWTDEMGNILELNKGKTWINVFADNGTVTIQQMGADILEQ